MDGKGMAENNPLNVDDGLSSGNTDTIEDPYSTKNIQTFCVKANCRGTELESFEDRLSFFRFKTGLYTDEEFYKELGIEIPNSPGDSTNIDEGYVDNIPSHQYSHSFQPNQPPSSDITNKINVNPIINPSSKKLSEIVLFYTQKHQYALNQTIRLSRNEMGNSMEELYVDHEGRYSPKQLSEVQSLAEVPEYIESSEGAVCNSNSINDGTDGNPSFSNPFVRSLPFMPDLVNSENKKIFLNLLSVEPYCRDNEEIRKMGEIFDVEKRAIMNANLLSLDDGHGLADSTTTSEMIDDTTTSRKFFGRFFCC